MTAECPSTRAAEDAWQWGGRGKIYCGPGAKQKAERQGRAAYAGGYQGAEPRSRSYEIGRAHV